MRDVLYIEELDQARALLKSPRVDVLKQMAEPINCTTLGERLGQSPQAIYYHVKALEKSGLVEKVEERRVRGIVEGVYQATARSYWVSPRLVGKLGGERATRDQLSLGYLIALAEEVQDDVGRLAQHAPGGEDQAPSLGLSAQIELKTAADRAAFMRDVQQAFQALAETYGARGTKRGRHYKLALACYPAIEERSSK
jgi:DNA-binding transcriptional ArsR family regulator